MSRRGKRDPDRGAHLLRFSIVGQLLSSPPPKGELQNTLNEMSARTWRHPVTGEQVRVGKSTLERWFYIARNAGNDPVTALRKRTRADAGRSRVMSAKLEEKIAAQYKLHPSWSIKVHYRHLCMDLDTKEIPSYATVRRYFAEHGLRKLRSGAEADKYFAAREIRSYAVEEPNLLWHLDAHKGSRNLLRKDGQWVKPVALCVIDDCSRLICHMQWFLDETTQSLVHAFSQALMRRGIPRSLMTDNGSAMIAEEFTSGLLTLGILHKPTLPRTPWSNGKQERLWGTMEGQLMAMLEGESKLTLELLNRATHSWIEGEYHNTVHEGLGCTPLDRYRAGPDCSRECPPAEELRAAFRITVPRTQRRTDGTIRLDNRRFEIPRQFGHLHKVMVRYARWDLSAVDLVDPSSDAVLCPLYPLDRAANADAHRRVVKPGEAAPPPVEAGMAPLLKKMMADREATGLPPPYLPTEDEDLS